MLEKFKHFFKKEPEVNPNSTSYMINPAGRTMQIMQASEMNIPDLLELEERVYQGKRLWLPFPFASEPREKYNSLYLVTCDRAQLIGFIGGRFIPCEGHIANVAATLAYQGQGIGHCLINLIIEIVKKNGVAQVSLEVRADNGSTRKIYENLGFGVQLVRTRYYQDNHVDTINMVLHLERKENTK